MAKKSRHLTRAEKAKRFLAQVIREANEARFDWPTTGKEWTAHNLGGSKPKVIQGEDIDPALAGVKLRLKWAVDDGLQTFDAHIQIGDGPGWRHIGLISDSMKLSVIPEGHRVTIMRFLNGIEDMAYHVGALYHLDEMED